uniref:Uncharacterized protein n=1 Tax=Tetradesmus obliquus TaxID=3088 RepID=A0A383V5A4_TETOB|eukprot:jgi/Sobl393_1/12613/SZX60787.1
MFAGLEADLIPSSPGVAAKPARDKRKDPKVWLAGELIVRCENQGLTSLPPQLWLKTTLRTLVLTDNALACLPPDIQLLKELRELHLGHNQLAQLPDEICLLSQLQHLDVQHNQLTEVPAGLCRLVHLAVLNLDGNPLCPALQQLWSAPIAVASSQQQPALSGRQAAAAATSRVKDSTQAVLQHLLEQQDSATVLQVKQAKLQLLQQASTQQILKLLHVADPDSLANCASIAAGTGLSSSLVQRIQQAQAATAEMQAALAAVEAVQGSSTPTGLEAGGAAHEQLSSALRHFESLCKLGRPSGPVYAAAHAMWRNLQRQALERGWWCSSPKSPAPAAAPAAAPAEDDAEGRATDTAQHDGSVRSSSSSPLGGRRFLTVQEQTRQRLEAAGAKKYHEWAAEKQRAEQLERQRVAAQAQQQAQSKVHVVASRAAKAVDNCAKEKAWPSKVEQFAHGTFSLPPEQLKAIRRAYQRPPPLQSEGSHEGSS